MAVSTTVITQYIQSQVDTVRWPLLESKNDVLKKVAAKVAGRKDRVMMVIARMSLLWRYVAFAMCFMCSLSFRKRLVSSRD